MKLSELKPGDDAVITKIHGHGAFRKRVIEMGFVPGHTVRMLLDAPLRDPVKYTIMGYELSLRLAEAAQIECVPVDAETATGNSGTAMPHENTGGATQRAREKARHESRTINIALIGNPNCGKTSLFNIASGAREHVGNYSGVTVDAKDGHFNYRGYSFNIVDLPGTYSLSCYSPEELYVRRYLSESSPDVIVNVVDSSNLERNLYLTTELIDMDYSMVIALNMYDELRDSGSVLDHAGLGAMIGVPMCPVVARNGEGIRELFDTVIAVYNHTEPSVRHVHVNLGADLEAAIRQIVDMLKATPTLEKHFSPRYLAIKLLEGDHQVETEIEGLANGGRRSDAYQRGRLRQLLHKLTHKPCCPDCEPNPLPEYSWRDNLRSGAGSPVLLLRDKLRGSIEKLHNEDISSIVAAEKYGFIAGALAETFTVGVKKERRTTRLLDGLATNRYLGFPIFLAIMFVIFWVTFSVGQYPMTWIENAVAWIGGIVDMLMPSGPLKDLIADGIIGGVGGVIVFLPNILILYFCISFMEDSGYMARAAFIMDKVMHRVGLHGKSFIPLVMGFGCNVPAIMSSRSIESHSSRLITILINPFMSCSARLPIYVLLIGTFFEAHAALVFMGIYLLGIAVAIITARLLRRFFFRKDETPFVMELPPYRMPTLKASMTHTWGKGREYLKKMGGIILFASIAVWALNYFPHHSTADGQAVDGDSYLEMAGKAINPVMEPLGFHWRASVAALAGVPAKEIVVSTLGVLYANDDSATDRYLGERLTAPSAETGNPDFTPAAALSFMVFVLLYCPCIATVTAIVRETRSWRYGAFSVLYNTAVAWLMAFAVYRLALL